MAEYKCGHNRTLVILSDNIAVYANYLRWRQTVGWEGTKEKCYTCFVKEIKEKNIRMNRVYG